jgi:hypothetical protein
MNTTTEQAIEVRKELKANPALLQRLVKLEEAHDVALAPTTDDAITKITGYQVIRGGKLLFWSPSLDLIEKLLPATK